MNIYVLLLRRAFRCGLVAVIIASITQDEELSETNPNEFVEKWEINVDDHGAYDIVTGYAIPFLIEIRVLSVEDIFGKRVAVLGELAIEIGIHEEQEEACVHDITDEDISSDDGVLARFCGAANVHKQIIYDQFDYHVSDNDQIITTILRNRGYVSIFDIVPTNGSLLILITVVRIEYGEVLVSILIDFIRVFTRYVGLVFAKTVNSSIFRIGNLVNVTEICKASLLLNRTIAVTFIKVLAIDLWILFLQIDRLFLKLENGGKVQGK